MEIGRRFGTETQIKQMHLENWTGNQTIAIVQSKAALGFS